MSYVTWIIRDSVLSRSLTSDSRNLGLKTSLCKIAALARSHGLTENLLISSCLSFHLRYSCLLESFCCCCRSLSLIHHFGYCSFSPSGKTTSGSICFKLKFAYNWNIYLLNFLLGKFFLMEPGKRSNPTLVLYVVKS